MAIIWAPKMKAIRMVVDIFGARRMKLNDRFISAPEQVLDETHLSPIWDAAPR
jgi:hypothetical protein